MNIYETVFLTVEKEWTFIMSHSNSSRKKSLISRAVGVLADPGPTFEDIVKSPDYVAPVIFILLAGVLTLVTTIHTLRSMPELFPSDIPMPAQSITIGISLVTFVIGQIFIWLLRALVFTGIGAMIGSKADYRKSLAVSGYLNITLVISGIITAIAIATTGQPVVLGLGMTLSPQDLATVKGVILSNINVYTLIYIVLSSVALAKLWDVKVSKAALITIIMWIIVVAASAGTAHLSSQLTQFQVDMGVSPN